MKSSGALDPDHSARLSLSSEEEVDDGDGGRVGSSFLERRVLERSHDGDVVGGVGDVDDVLVGELFGFVLEDASNGGRDVEELTLEREDVDEVLRRRKEGSSSVQARKEQKILKVAEESEKLTIGLIEDRLVPLGLESLLADDLVRPRSKNVEKLSSETTLGLVSDGGSVLDLTGGSERELRVLESEESRKERKISDEFDSTSTENTKRQDRKTHVQRSVVDLVGSISDVSKDGVGRLDEIDLEKKEEERSRQFLVSHSFARRDV